MPRTTARRGPARATRQTARPRRGANVRSASPPPDADSSPNHAAIESGAGGLLARSQAALAASVDTPAHTARHRRCTRRPREDAAAGTESLASTGTAAASALTGEDCLAYPTSSQTNALSDDELASTLEHRLMDFRSLQAEERRLRERAAAAASTAAIVAESRQSVARGVPAVRLVVGGERFTVPVHTLLGRDPGTYFHALLNVQRAQNSAAGDAFNGHSGSSDPGEAAASVQAMASTGVSTATAVASTTAAATSATAALSMSQAPPSQRRRKECTAASYESDGSGTGSPSGDGADVWAAPRGPSWAVRPFAKGGNSWAAAGFPAEVFTDDTGAIFLDRDPATFRHILNYLRGYHRFRMLDGEELAKLRVDAAYFRLHGLREIISETDANVEFQFKSGPGVNVERNRFRGVYSVATIGEAFMVTGQHSISFQVLATEYVGVGLVSEAFMNQDAEFHKTANCAVYYMSGVFYTNFPNYRKEEGLAKFESGDYVTLNVNMDKGYAEVVVKHATKMFSLGRARRLKFAVTLKLSSQVRIVPPEEAAEVARRLQVSESEDTAHVPAQSTAYRPLETPVTPADAVNGIVMATVVPQPPPPQQQLEHQLQEQQQQELLSHVHPSAQLGSVRAVERAFEEEEDPTLVSEYLAEMEAEEAEDEAEGDGEGEWEEEGEYAED